MKKITMKWWKMVFFLILPCVLVGCGKTRDTAKIRDLEFTVIDQERIPEELKAIIEEKKVQPFKMTYSDGDQPVGECRSTVCRLRHKRRG